jgi:hypothetical protein
MFFMKLTAAKEVTKFVTSLVGGLLVEGIFHRSKTWVDDKLRTTSRVGLDITRAKFREAIDYVNYGGPRNPIPAPKKTKAAPATKSAGTGSKESAV